MNASTHFGHELNLTPWQKMLVRESLESVRGYSDSVATLFYGRLFELAPQVRPLLEIEMRARPAKLLDKLSILVDALERFDDLRGPLADLGRRYREYSVEPKQYPSVDLGFRASVRPRVSSRDKDGLGTLAGCGFGSYDRRGGLN